MIRILLALMLLLASVNISGQDYYSYFTDNGLRVNMLFRGDINKQQIAQRTYVKDPYYSGPRRSHYRDSELGEYRIVIRDINTDKVVYSKGFCTLFEEYITTEQGKIKSGDFQESINVPFPEKIVKIDLEHRDSLGRFTLLDSDVFDPAKTKYTDFKESLWSERIHGTRDYREAYDLVIMADGYTADERDKFIKDAKKQVEYIFKTEPFKGLKDYINIWLVFAPSIDSGIDQPHIEQYKNTELGTQFSLFGVDRYVGTYDYWRMGYVGAHVPGDGWIVLANTSIYGGGGIYNHYAITVADHGASGFVLVHEMGHSVAGLADEYYNSVVAYDDFFSDKYEPWQANITNMINFESKWKSMIDVDVPVPTPDISKYRDCVGVFEGAGYSAKGMYRPYHNCIMKSHSAKGFCPVCQKAIRETIMSYTNTDKE
jgi:hypothetical protein